MSLHQIAAGPMAASPFFEKAAIARDRYFSHLRRSIEDLNSDPNLAIEVLIQPKRTYIAAAVLPDASGCNLRWS